MNAFLDRLTTFGKRSIKLNEAARAYRAAFPEFADSADFWIRLVRSLEELELEGKIGLPNRASWNKQLRTARPKTLTLTGHDTAPATKPAFAWAPALSFAADINHSAALRDLAAINEWLIATRGQSRLDAPCAERSLEIFGDEKRLDELRTGNLLFGGKLHLNTLKAFAVDPPIVIKNGVYPDRPILVLENLASYTSCSTWNNDPRSGHPWGAVAWGMGEMVQRAAPQFKEHLRPGQRICYLGDIDFHGIAILRRFINNAANIGVSVQPHVEGYRYLLANGRQVSRRTTVTTQIEDALKLLPTDVAEEIRLLFSNNTAIPQESLGLEQLARGALASAQANAA